MPSVGVKVERGRRRLAVWLFIVPVLFLFSASLVGNALASRSSMEAKAGDLIPAGHGAADGLLVKFLDGSDDGVSSRVKSVFGLAQMKQLCWVTPATAAVLSRQYETREHTVTVRGRGTFGMLIVFDGDADAIRDVLNQGRCTLISDPWRTFYLPFQPHIS